MATNFKDDPAVKKTIEDLALLDELKKYIDSENRYDKAKQLLKIEQDILKVQQEQYQLMSKLSKEEVASGERAAEKDEKLQRHLTKQYKANAKNLAQGVKQEKLYTAQAKGLEATNGLVDSIGTSLGLSASNAGRMAGSLITSYRQISKMSDPISALAVMGRNLKDSFFEAFSFTNIVSSIAGAIWKETTERFTLFDEQLSSLNATLGDAGASAKATGRAINFGMGVDIQQATAAAKGLGSSFTTFTSLSTKAKSALIGTAAELERVGIGASTTGQGMTTLTNAMGMTADEGDKVWKGLAASAAAFGKTPDALASDFISASKTLMAHGPNMMSVFKDLEATAMASGLAMDTLLGVASKFDTFDSAAGSVGNLNALLGGDYLNTLEMMNMNEAERVQALKSSLDMAGKNFDQMERFERKAVAEQMGMDEQQLAQMMNSSGRAARQARKEAKEKEKDTKAYNKMVKSTVTLTEKIRMLFTSIFNNTGLATAFGDAFGVLFKALRPGSPFGDAVRSIVKLIGTGMTKAFEMAIGWATKFFSASGEGFKKISKWTDVLTTFFEEFTAGGESSEKAWENLKAKVLEGLGLDEVFSGEGEGSMAASFASGVESVTKTIKGPVFNPVRKALVELFLDPMANAMKVMGESMSESNNPLSWAAGDFLTDMSKGMKKVSNTLSTDGIMGPQGQSMMKDAGTMAADGFVMGLEPVKADTVEVFEAIPELIEQSLEVKSPSKVFERIGKAINDGFKIGLSPDGMKKMFDGLIESTEEWAESLKDVADQVRDIAVATTGGGGSAAGAAGNSRITLELDGKIMAEYIIDTVERKAKVLGVNR
jgi:hypothetical protein